MDRGPHGLLRRATGARNHEIPWSNPLTNPLYSYRAPGIRGDLHLPSGLTKDVRGNQDITSDNSFPMIPFPATRNGVPPALRPRRMSHWLKYGSSLRSNTSHAFDA